MKRFINPFETGGAPIFNDDLLEILQEQQYDILKGQFSNLRKNAHEGLVISGVEVSAGSDFDVTSGVVFLDGDFYLLDAETAVSNPSYIVVGSDVITQRLFRDGAGKNIIVEKKAIIQSSIPVSGQYITINRTNMGFSGEWTKFTDVTTLLNGWATSSESPLEFRKNQNGTVDIRGALIYDGTGGTTSTIAISDTGLSDIAPGDNALNATGSFNAGVINYFNGSINKTHPVNVQGGVQSSFKFSLNVPTNDLPASVVTLHVNLQYSQIDF